MKRRLILILAMLAVLPASSWGVATMSNYRVFIREILTPDLMNNMQTHYTTKINELIAKFPGDTLKVTTLAGDTLVSATLGRIVVKDPLIGVNVGDTLNFFISHFQRTNTDTIGGGTLGIGTVFVNALSQPAGQRTTLAYEKVDSLFSGAMPVAPIFSSGWTAGNRVRMNLLSTDSLRVVDSLTVGPASKTRFIAGSIFQAANLSLDTLAAGPLAAGTKATGIFDITTASNWKLGGTAFTGTMAGLNTAAAVTYGTGVTTFLATPSSANLGSALTDETGSGAAVFGTTPTFTTSALLGSGFIFNWNSGDVTLTHAANTLTWGGAASGYVFNNGNVYINDTSNAVMTGPGMTINQGGSDDEILTLKSSDVAHGVTGLTETDSYAVFGKVAAQGGLQIYSLDGTNAIAGLWRVVAGTENTTHSGAGTGAITFTAGKTSGAGTQVLAANGNLFLVRDTNNAAKFIVDQEGDLFADGGSLSTTMVTLYDGWNDVDAISTFDHLQAEMTNAKIIDSEWENYERYNEQDLIDMHILGGPRVGVDPKERGLINFTGLVRLHNGAIRQLGRGQAMTDSEVDSLIERNDLLESRVAKLEIAQFFAPTNASIFERN